MALIYIIESFAILLCNKWNMFNTFKTQKDKIEYYHQNNCNTRRPLRPTGLTIAKSNTTTCFGLKKINKSIAYSQYALYSKSILHQLMEEFELGVLKQKTFEEKKDQILFVLKKCDFQIKGQIFIKLAALYFKRNTKMQAALMEMVQLMISYIQYLGQKNIKKFCEMILLQRIDQILIFIVKCYPNNREQLTSKIAPIIAMMHSVKKRMSVMMSKQDYQLFIVCLSYWSLTNIKRQNKVESSHNNADRSSNVSKDSFCSMTSQTSELYRQRLKRFDQTRQNNDYFKRNLQILSQNKKKRSVLKAGSFRASNSSKRVSTTWGKSQIGSKQIIRKNQNAGLSKFTPNNGPRRSILSMQKEQFLIRKNSSFDFDKFANQTQGCQFTPFYFYTIIKGMIRIIKVENFQIMGEKSKLKVKLNEYFTHSLIFHKFHQSFLLKIECQKLKKFILANVQLVEKKMWMVLVSKLKIQHQSNEQENKNIISELLPPQQNFKFYGFIKKRNVFFFTKYESEHEKSFNGTMTIFDKQFEGSLQKLNIINWTKKQLIQFDEKEQDKDHKNEYSFQQNCISTGDCNIKAKLTRSKLNYPQKIVELLKCNKKQIKNKVYIQTIKKQHKFKIISESHNKNHILYSNLAFQTRFRNLFECSSEKRSFQTKENNYIEKIRFNYLASIDRKNKSCAMGVLNRRMSKPIYVNILRQICFTKMFCNLGFIVFKIFVFKPQQSQMVIVQAYLPHNQKYYQFPFKSTLIKKYADMFNSNISNQSLSAFLTKNIKVSKNMQSLSSQSGNFELCIQMDSIIIQAQELLFRKCQCDDGKNLLFIDSYTLKNLESKGSDVFEIRREVNKISKNLKNQKFEIIKLKKQKPLKNCKKYSKLLAIFKQQLERRIQTPINLFKKNKNQFYYKFGVKNGKLIKSNFHQGKINLTTFDTFSVFTKKQTYEIKENEDNFILTSLKGKPLVKYFGRIMKDPLLFKFLKQKLQ